MENMKTQQQNIQQPTTLIPILFHPFLTINCISPFFLNNNPTNLLNQTTTLVEEKGQKTEENKQRGIKSFKPVGKEPSWICQKNKNENELCTDSNPTKKDKLQIHPSIQDRLSQDDSKELKELKKSNWTQEEDDLISEMVSLFGKQWKNISEHFPGRTSKQIRQRYLNYLRPNISHEKWAAEQDAELMELVKKYGSQWKIIEKIMTTRSQNQLKNRYYGKLKKIMEKKQSLKAL